MAIIKNEIVQITADEKAAIAVAAQAIITSIKNDITNS